MNKKIGIVAMFRLDAGGGAPRVTIDLINALNSLGKEVYLLTPFKLDYKKIKELYGPIKINKIYFPNKLKSLLCKGRALPRKLIKKEVQKMAKEVDKIIDIDGGIIHNYLTKNFDKEKYLIWRISCVKPESERVWIKKSFKRKIKTIVQDFLGDKRCIPSRKHKIYPVDKWTKKELKDYWDMESEEICLYPEIKVDEFLKEKRKKKNQAVIFGRMAPNKSVEDSIKIFAYGTKKYPDYNLTIMGGATADSEDYIAQLKSLAKELGIEKKVKFVKNPSFEELKKILAESKVLIDSQKEISLTMTSIEAMAAGCMVLGYKNSGSYIDILDNGKYGYGFLNPEEGGKILENLLKLLNERKINNKESIKRSVDFSGERFKKTLKIILGEK